MPMRPSWRSLVIAILLLSAESRTAVCQSNSSAPPLATANIRREVPLNPAQAPALRESLHSLFQERAIQDRTNPDRFEIRSGSEIAVVELRGHEGRTVIAGSPRVTMQLAKFTSAATAIGPGVVPSSVMPLNANARAALERSRLLEPSAMIQGSSRIRLPSFIGLRPALLTSAQQTNPLQQDNTGLQNNQPIPPAPNQLNNPALQPPPAQDGPVPLQPFDGVEVEMLPDIDAIILRGRDQQLQDLAEIIRRLDEASQLAQPEIEVIPLQHTQAESLAELMESTRLTLLGSRQGRATVLPLVKPNALLLIGWGEAAAVAKELIAKLDMPVAPGTQFDVIQLQHAVASEVQTQLQSFFQNRGGLGPSIQSTVDARTNAIIVHAAPRDLQEVRMLIERLDVPRGGAMQHARVFEIQNSLASDIAQLLQQALTSANGSLGAIELRDKDGNPLATSGILGNSRITVNERNNSIIVAAAPENMELIQRFIEQLDTPGMVAKIKIFPIFNGDAAALVETLRALLPSQAPGAAPAPQLSSAADESSLVPLRFTVDARGNNIIAIGSDGDLKIVEALIVRLDESDTMQRKSTVYQLKNSPAVDVALAINEFLRNKRQVESSSPGANNPFEQLEKEVVVVPEPVQNKLILSATPRYYEEIAKLIEQLDQQPPQVMIQVMIAEISLGDTDEFGIEMGLQNSVLFDRSLLGDLLTRTTTTSTSTPAGVVTETVQDIVAASNVPGFNFNSTAPLGNSGAARTLASGGQVGGQGISNFAVGRESEARGFGGLVLSASSENVSFLLRALQDSRRLEILSRPQVLTLDNQQAFIQVGQRVPRIVNSIINQNGAQNNVELENVGLIIGVTPRISPEGTVVMEIDAEKSKLGPENEGIPVSIAADGTVIRSPRVDTITAQATVSAADGETIILGGLISRSVRTIHRQVPWLGDIPIIKHFFSYDLFDMERTELLIIMTPHVVRSQGDMERLKQAEFARMSWCEADVFSIHGDVYPSTMMTNDMIERGEWNVVYPDVDPRGASIPSVSEAPELNLPAPRSSSPGLSNPGLSNPGYFNPGYFNPGPSNPSGFDLIPAPPAEPTLVPSSGPGMLPTNMQTATFNPNQPVYSATAYGSSFPTVPDMSTSSGSFVVPASASNSLVPNASPLTPMGATRP